MSESDYGASSSSSGSPHYAAPLSAAAPGPRDVSEHRKRTFWTADEDERLVAATQIHGSSRGKDSAKRWGAIAKVVGGGRTVKDCRKRWFHSVDPTVKKGRWSKEEDAKLVECYATMGPKWKDIALQIPGRKDDQVAKRWRDALDPSLTRDTHWTSAEDALLLALHEEVGARWTFIADQLPGRSALHCRNRLRKYEVRPNRTKRLQKPTPSSTAPSTTSTKATTNDSLFDINEFCSSLAITPASMPLPFPLSIPPVDIIQPAQETEPPVVINPLTLPGSPPKVDASELGQAGFNLDLERLTDWVYTNSSLSDPPIAAIPPQLQFHPCTHCHGTGYTLPHSTGAPASL